MTVQSEDGSHTANIQMTSEGVKVEAQGEGGTSKIDISQKGLEVQANNGGATTDVSVNQEGVKVDVDQQEPASNRPDEMKFGVGSVNGQVQQGMNAAKNANVSIDAGGVKVNAGNGGANVQIDGSARRSKIQVQWPRWKATP